METVGLEYVVDPRLKDKYPKGIYKDMVKLAIDCASFTSEERPSMKVKKKQSMNKFTQRTLQKLKESSW